MTVTTISPVDSENAVLEKLAGDYEVCSEMSLRERQFLNSLLLRKKPKKILEVGVSSGSSSVIILNALEEIEAAKLYSIDKLEYYYKDSSLPCGFILEKYSTLKKKHALFSGSFACSFMDEIGDGIDFCFIDTVHALPGEVLDFLMVLPYLTENCTLVFHDTQLHTAPGFPSSYSNGLVMSAIYGEKILPFKMMEQDSDRSQYPNFPFPAYANIGGISINKETRAHIWELLNLLTLRWVFELSESEYRDIYNYFTRFYSDDELDFFAAIYKYQAALFKKELLERESLERELQWEKRNSPFKRFKYSFKKNLYGLCAALMTGNSSEYFRHKQTKYSKLLLADRETQ